MEKVTRRQCLSELGVNTCNHPQAQENLVKRVCPSCSGFGFASDWSEEEGGANFPDKSQSITQNQCYPGLVLALN